MKKRLAVILSLILACAIFSGCMADVSQIAINEDGTGACVIYTGFEENEYNKIIEEMGIPAEEMNDEEAVVFEYDDKTYIGHVIKFDFADIAELNDTINLHFGSEDVNVDKGMISFGIDGEKLKLEVNSTEETGDTQSTQEQAQMAGIDFDEEAIKKLEESAIVLDITFPNEVVKTSGADVSAIKVDGKNLTINYMQLSKDLDGKAETFTFESAIKVQDKSEDKTVIFEDVKEDDWYYNQVMEMVAKGLFNGKGDNLFCPDDTMTKAEFIAVASRILWTKPILNLCPGDDTIWWDRYYNMCVTEGLFSEEDFDYAKMDDGMTRQEMALVASRVAESQEGFEYPEVWVSEEDISDISEADEKFIDYITFCYSLGILCGADEEGSFKPNDTLTRAEASTVLYRIINADARINN